MACPDELVLDLWLADALPPDDASTVTAHVGSCSRCAALRASWLDADASLRSALTLDEHERAYLGNLDLAAAWRARPAHAIEAHWGWLAAFGVIAAFVAWAVAAQPFDLALTAANEVGVGTILLTTAIELVLGISQTLIELATSPALGVSQPLLAVLAITLLFWPRITSAPHFLQGVRS